jgi:hypothetical protein
MKQVSSADFRKLYARENEPVEVTAYGKVIGVWYPTGADLSDIPDPDAPYPPAIDPSSPYRMTIRPAQPRPKMVARESKRVLDPVDLQNEEVKHGGSYFNRALPPKVK